MNQKKDLLKIAKYKLKCFKEEHPFIRVTIQDIAKACGGSRNMLYGRERRKPYKNDSFRKKLAVLSSKKLLSFVMGK